MSEVAGTDPRDDPPHDGWTRWRERPPLSHPLEPTGGDDVSRRRGPRLTAEIPAIATTGALADELGLTPSELDWFADRRALERHVPDGPLRHYSRRWIPKPTGGARLLEVPKPRLRQLQRRILHEILDAVPPHRAADGFRPGRSVHTFVAPHAGQATVVRIDLADFFASVRAGRIRGMFHLVGYPPPVAAALTGLVTTTTPRAVREGFPEAPRAGDERAGAERAGRPRARLNRATDERLRRPHLPQGAPTSPALANLVAYRLDRRLAGLARAWGLTYTRDADDLAFSGDDRTAWRADQLVAAVTRIVADEGFATNPAKTRVRRASQQQRLAGLVVNERPAVSRADYDRLRAVLHDAALHGPDVANRERHPDFRAHLLGRIAWVASTDAARGERLRARYDQIVW